MAGMMHLMVNNYNEIIEARKGKLSRIYVTLPFSIKEGD
jgi:hypothetical protein